jgi:hypothetical protein
LLKIAVALAPVIRAGRSTESLLTPSSQLANIAFQP